MDKMIRDKIIIRLGIVIVCLGGLAMCPVFGQEIPRSGFMDADGDGRNDWFRDANGDGVNDVDGRPYPHHFRFEDRNGDGINDLWVDADGDGVNDLLHEFQKKGRWIDRDGDGIQDEVLPLRGKALTDHILDVNRDGRNDITGEPYSDRDLGGSRHGFILEETGQSDPSRTQAGRDGMKDSPGTGRGRDDRNLDQFIDLDGDGIADDRGLGRLRGAGKGKGKP